MVGDGRRDSSPGAAGRLGAAAVCLAISIAVLGAAATAQASPPPRNPTAAKSGIQQPDLNLPSLHEALAGYFPIGTAIWRGDITGPHADLLKRHFNAVVAENAMKWSVLRPSEATFDFANADALVGFAQANHMLVRGHTLVWHQQNPPWLFQDAGGNGLQPTPENKALLLRRLEQHIRRVVSRYRDDVYAWDVVNEVIDPNQPDGLRRSPWFLLTGTDYIDTAFRVAHEVAPQARLFINEVDSTDPVKRRFLYELVRDLQRRGVPVDGVGHQLHSNLDNPSPASIVETVNMFAALGLDNQITELDISLYHNATDTSPAGSREALIAQGYRYRDFFQAFRQLHGKLSAVMVWGYADDHTWRKRHPVARPDLPLLFDEQLQAKPAFWGIVDPQRLPARAQPPARP